jgi:hypothetical protein
MPDATQLIGLAGQPVQLAPVLDWANGQVVAFTTHAESAAIAANGVILCSTADCWYTVGSTPVATVGAGSLFLPAGVLWGQTILSGQKISVVQNAAGGTLSIMPVKAF